MNEPMHVREVLAELDAAMRCPEAVGAAAGAESTPIPEGEAA